jgi:hypothetical protein
MQIKIKLANSFDSRNLAPRRKNKLSFPITRFAPVRGVARQGSQRNDLSEAFDLAWPAYEEHDDGRAS